MPIVLCSDLECRFTDADLQRIRGVAEIQFSPDYRLETLLPLIPEADVLVFSCFASIPGAVLEAGERLRGAVKYGVGVDNIDLAAADRLQIPVANCPDYGSGAIADHAFAMLLALARKLTGIDRRFRDAGWFWPEDAVVGESLEGATLGIIGLGRIGRKMARRASGFEMRLLACDPYVSPHEVEDEPFSVEFTSLERLLAESDYVSIHCVLTDETRCLIDASALRQMKSSAVLIDVSRGAIIDEPALVEALQNGRLAGVGLDVFGEEPLPKDHPLLQLKNVIATPHLAWFTRQAAAEQSRQAADAVLAILAGRAPESIVNGVHTVRANDHAPLR